MALKMDIHVKVFPSQQMWVPHVICRPHAVKRDVRVLKPLRTHFWNRKQLYSDCVCICMHACNIHHLSLLAVLNNRSS